MSNSHLPQRYLMFLAGIIFTALGISLITRAGMGTSAVSSLSYVLTFVVPSVSFGTFTFVVNGLMLLGQIMILRRAFPAIQLLQLPATLVFSVCVDLWMYVLGFAVPEAYGARWVALLLGCCALGLGVALQVMPNVLILPCEGFVRTVSQRWAVEFGKAKTGYDLAMVAAAALICVLCLGRVEGLREGTVVCALVVGSISRFCCRCLRPLTDRWDEPQVVRA